LWPWSVEDRSNFFERKRKGGGVGERETGGRSQAIVWIGIVERWRIGLDLVGEYPRIVPSEAPGDSLDILKDSSMLQV